MGPPSQPTNYWGMYIALGVYVLYAVTCLSLFLARRHREPIRSRGWQLVVAQVVWGIVDASFGCLQGGDLPVFCWLVMWIEPLFIIFICLPHILRAIMLYHLYSWNWRKLYPKADDATAIPRYRYLTSMRVNFFALFAAVAVSLIVVLIVRITTYPPMPVWGHPTVCFINTFYVTIAQAVIAALLFFMCIWLLWDSQDGYHFKTELKGFAVAFPLFYAWWAITFGLDALPIYWNSITPMIGTSVTTAISTLYPVYLSYRREWTVAASDEEEAERLPTEYSSEDELTIPTSQRPRRPDFKSTADLFQVILGNPILLSAFRKFALDLWCVENLLFFEAVESFGRIHDLAEQQTQAKVIYNLYVRPDALREINVDDAPRQIVHDRMANNDISATMFDTLKMGVFHQMRLDTFAKFRVSESFKHAWIEAGFGKAPVFRKAGASGNDRTASGDEEEERHVDQMELVDMSSTALELLRDSVAANQEKDE